MKPISVIASFDEKGVTPHRIQLTEEGIKKSFDLYDIILYEKRRDMLKYKCKIVVDDSKRSCEIVYTIDTMKWLLLKIY